MSRRPRRALGLLALLAAGCGAQPLYYWGHYQPLLYEMYAKPGSAQPEQQIEQLSEDLATADAKGLAVPPGVHAHLGYMYLLEGNALAARSELESEKRLYPESAVFMDRLLDRLAAP